MFDKILIANRGEIAVRITAPARNSASAASPSIPEADADSLHVQLADEAICIGKPPSTESYLKIDRIISAAEVADVEPSIPATGSSPRMRTSPRSARTATSNSSARPARHPRDGRQGGRA